MATPTPPRARTATPWGPATVVDEVKLPQQAGEKRFASVFQLLTSAAGEPLVRIAYTTGGVIRRGPVTLRARDIERLHKALAKQAALSEALGLRGGS